MYKEVVDFIRQIYNSQDNILLHSPFFNGNEKKYLVECIDSTYVSSVGHFVDRFEEMTSVYTKAKKAVVCVNGTNALHLALHLVGVDQNDEVLTQSLTFVATVNAISYVGATPVFIDVDRKTLGLSPEKLEEWLSANTFIKSKICYNKKSGRRIKACVPMHTFGHPTRIDAIIEVCNKYHIDVVEDAAESLGSFYKGQHTGTFGKIGVISYNGNKTITTGGGGMLLFQDEDLGRYAKHLTTQAKVNHRWDFVHDHIGYNYRMPNINAALGCAQMENLDYILKNKRETAQLYKSFFQNVPDIQFMEEPENSKSNYWLNAIILKDKEKRDDFLNFTNDCGIMTRPAWTLMNKLEMFKECQADDLTNTLWLEDRIVNIPSGVRSHV